jgi:peptide/nickel transport system permease protein
MTESGSHAERLRIIGGQSNDSGLMEARPSQSPVRIFWTEFRKSPLAIVGGGLLSLFYLLALFAPFMAPYPQEEMNRQGYFHPPHRLHWIDHKGRFHLTPSVYGTRLVDPATFRYEEDPALEVKVTFLGPGYPYKLFGIIPAERHLFGVPPPAHIFLFGSDSFGRDVFSRVLYGAQISLTVGLVGIAISFTLGMLLGGVSGYFGGIADTVIMRATELLLSVPSL